jgi:hypothetical protein
MLRAVPHTGNSARLISCRFHQQLARLPRQRHSLPAHFSLGFIYAKMGGFSVGLSLLAAAINARSDWETEFTMGFTESIFLPVFIAIK